MLPLAIRLGVLPMGLGGRASVERSSKQQREWHFTENEVSFSLSLSWVIQSCGYNNGQKEKKWQARQCFEIHQLFNSRRRVIWTKAVWRGWRGVALCFYVDHVQCQALTKHITPCVAQISPRNGEVQALVYSRQIRRAECSPQSPTTLSQEIQKE